MKYKGVKILIKEVEYGFDYITFNYSNLLIIYINKKNNINKKSLIVHKTLKDYFKKEKKKKRK